MENLTLITGNPNKAEQIARLLGRPIAHKALELPELQSLDLEELAREKARQAFATIQAPVLVEDTSLSFRAMGRLPGPFIKWFESEMDFQQICNLLNEDRRATAQTTLALCAGAETHVFTGIVQGTIATSPRGEGFGWDVIFIPDGSTKTRSDMDREEHDRTSMRRLAVEKLQAFLSA